MGTIRTFEFSERGLEQHADFVKRIVVEALVKDGLLEFDQAEEWTKTRTVLMRKKSFFRTITNLWNNEPEFEHHCLVVRLVE